MTDFEPVAHEPHSPHSLISWPAVIAGAAVAVAAGAMLDLLGVALGAGALNPFDLAHAGARAFTVGAGLWMALANILALFAGGLVASRAAKHDDHHHGMLHGLMVWAIAFLVVVFVAGSMAGGGPAAALGIDSAANDAAAPFDASSASGVLQSDGSIAPPDASAAGAPAATAAPAARTPVVVQKATDPAATLALWSFLTMLLGAAGAVFGGRYGARKHAWETRAPPHDPNMPHLPPRL